MLHNTKLWVIGFWIVLIGGITSYANACEPAEIPLIVMIQSAPIVVKGKLLKAKASFNPKPALFRVEQSLRGYVPPGDYQIAEGGPWGSQCEYGEMGVSYPDRSATLHIGDPEKEDGRYLLLDKRHGNVLVTSIGWGYGISIHLPAGVKLTDLQNASLLPNELPKAELSFFDYMFGFSLGLFVLGIIGYVFFKKKFAK